MYYIDASLLRRPHSSRSVSSHHHRCPFVPPMGAATGQRRCSITSKALCRAETSQPLPAGSRQPQRSMGSSYIERVSYMPSWFEGRNPYSDYYYTLLRRCSITRNAHVSAGAPSGKTTTSVDPSPETSQWLPSPPIAWTRDRADTPQPLTEKIDEKTNLLRARTTPWTDVTRKEHHLSAEPTKNDKVFEQVVFATEKSESPSAATAPDLLQSSQQLLILPYSSTPLIHRRYHCLIHGHLFSPFRSSQIPLEPQLSSIPAIAALAPMISCPRLATSDKTTRKTSSDSHGRNAKNDCEAWYVCLPLHDGYG